MRIDQGKSCDRPRACNCGDRFCSVPFQSSRIEIVEEGFPSPLTFARGQPRIRDFPLVIGPRPRHGKNGPAKCTCSTLPRKQPSISVMTPAVFHKLPRSAYGSMRRGRQNVNSLTKMAHCVGLPNVPDIDFEYPLIRGRRTAVGAVQGVAADCDPVVIPQTKLQ